MQAKDFRKGERWLLRHSPHEDGEHFKVALLELIKGPGPRLACIVRIESGERRGERIRVQSGRLRMPWSEWVTMSEIRKRGEALRAKIPVGPYVDHITEEAIEYVLDAAGEHERIHGFWGGVSLVQVEAMNRLLARSNLRSALWEDYHHDYIDEDRVLVDCSIFEEVAPAFTRAEPETIDEYLKIDDEVLRSVAHQVDRLKIYLLFREWMGVNVAGAPRDLEGLNRELRAERYHRLLMTALNELRKAGLNGKADHIERELESYSAPPDGIDDILGNR